VSVNYGEGAVRAVGQNASRFMYRNQSIYIVSESELRIKLEVRAFYVFVGDIDT
jgi:hypothetical protein